MKTPRRDATRGRSAARGFTLVELAMMLLIVGLVLGSMLFTLTAQVEQSNRAETLRRLESAKELLLAFAIANGRLPCPARSNSVGREVRRDEDDISSVTPAHPDYGKCLDDIVGVEDYYGGLLTAYVPAVTGGLLPAVTIGFQPVDTAGFAVDAWGNRIRYAVAKTVNIEAAVCPTPVLPHFTHKDNLKKNGISCKPGDLIVCSQAQAITTCAPGVGISVTNQNTVAAIVFSTGKNGGQGPQGVNETENVDGGGNIDPVYVSRPSDAAGATGGEFDDTLVWIPAALLYGRLIAAGALP